MDNLDNPALVYTITDFGSSHNIHIDSGGYLYVVGAEEHDIWIYDLSIPELPDLVGTWDGEYFHDIESMWVDVQQDPWVDGNGFPFYKDNFNLIDSLYFGKFSDGVTTGEWEEGNIFGGHDRFFSTSNALTNEFRFDITSQLNNKIRARMGIDLKSHKLNFYEVANPWADVAASRQRFSEQWDDYGTDGVSFLYSETGEPDKGEGNGQWDPGEIFDDFNGNGKWDDFVLLGLTASATFAVLDIGLTPSIASTARKGAGFGLGAGVVGWPGGAM